MYISCDKKGLVVAVSDHPIKIAGNETIQTDDANVRVGRRFKNIEAKRPEDLKVAVVCNWNLPCGISTYSKFLVDALKPKVKELRVFSEAGEPLSPDPGWVTRCWERGRPHRQLVDRLAEYKADFTILQHEYGIFPNACHFLNLLQALDRVPYVVALHSVYEHLDKTICTAPIRAAVVHSNQGKEVLRRFGHNMPVFVVPHGCFRFEDATELWNIFRNPYAMVQFGFGFYYKGVDRALEAVSILKKTDEKFKDIFYCYLCSENPHNCNLHDQYIEYLNEKAKDLDIVDNIAIIRGYQDERIINNYLRTAKLAIFPYRNNPENTVYGASGAIRIAMANRVPIIASESHLFDDLEGVLPRPDSSEALATAIDEIFSNGEHRDQLLARIDAHTRRNSWDHTADCYLCAYKELVGG